MPDWVTTLGGIMAAIGGVLSGAEAAAHVTVPDWLKVAGLVLFAVGSALMGSAAKGTKK